MRDFIRTVFIAVPSFALGLALRSDMYSDPEFQIGLGVAFGVVLALAVGGGILAMVDSAASRQDRLHLGKHGAHRVDRVERK